MKSNPPHKQQPKKRRKILWIFFPISIIIIAIIIFLGLWFGCKKTYITINQDTPSENIKEIYRNGDSDPTYKDVRGINVASLFKDKDHAKGIKISGEINSPLFFADGFATDIIGINNAKIAVGAGEAAIIYGNTTMLNQTNAISNHITIKDVNVTSNNPNEPTGKGISFLLDLTERSSVSIKNCDISDVKTGIEFHKQCLGEINISNNSINCSSNDDNTYALGIRFTDPVRNHVNITNNEIRASSKYHSCGISEFTNYNNDATFTIKNNNIYAYTETTDNQIVSTARCIGFATDSPISFHIDSNVCEATVGNNNQNNEIYGFYFDGGGASGESGMGNSLFTNTQSNPGCHSTDLDVVNWYNIAWTWSKK